MPGLLRYVPLPVALARIGLPAWSDGTYGQVELPHRHAANPSSPHNTSATNHACQTRNRTIRCRLTALT